MGRYLVKRNCRIGQTHFKVHPDPRIPVIVEIKSEIEENGAFKLMCDANWLQKLPDPPKPAPAKKAKPKKKPLKAQTPPEDLDPKVMG
jgi:hypothetical protein